MSKGSTPPVMAMRRVSQTKCSDVVVFQKAGIFLEDLAFVWLFYVHLDCDQAFPADLVEELVHHLQGFEITRLAEGRSLENAEYAADHRRDDRQRVGDEQRTDGSTADGDHLGRLKENEQLAVLHEEACDDRSEDHDEPDDGEHDSP
jgi:hypothetical protein